LTPEGHVNQIILFKTKLDFSYIDFTSPFYQSVYLPNWPIMTEDPKVQVENATRSVSISNLILDKKGWIFIVVLNTRQNVGKPTAEQVL